MLNDKMEREVQAFDRIGTLLTNNMEIVASVEALASAKAQLEQLRNILSQQVEKWDIVYKGRVQDRDYKESELLRNLLKILAGLHSTAFRTKNNILLEQVKISKSALEDMKPTNLVQKAKEIVALANTYQVDLLKYNIDQAIIDDTLGKIDAFKASAELTSEKYAAKTAEMINIKGTISGIYVFLQNDLDQVIITLEDTHHDFVTEYHECRKVRDFGVRHEPAENSPAPVENPVTPVP